MERNHWQSFKGEQMKFTKDHEWLIDDSSVYVVGITDYAQESLGDVVYVELPEVGASVTQGEAVAVVESVKAASDIYSPLTGEIVEVNEILVDSPELVNESPQDEGWFFKIEPKNLEELDDCMDEEEYQEFIL